MKNQNGIKNKVLPLFIVICILLPCQTFAATDDTRYYESSCKWETYNENPDLFGTLTGLPAGTTPLAKGRPFNYRIWFAKGKVVYGTYRDANPDDGVRVNYKEGTLNPSGIGFYKKSGRDRGEYRYHGFTKDGNLYTNIDFPNDVNTATPLEEKAWIYKYWDSYYVNSHFPGEPSLNISSYTKAAIYNGTFEEKKTRDWINKGVSAFKIRNGVMDTGINNPAPGKNADGTWDFCNFINVLSAPSARFSGEGRMFRLTSNGGLFYQTFTINKHKKEHTPVNVSVDILNENNLHFEDFGSTNPPDFDSQTIDVKVQVTATLKDEDYINNEVKKAVYYTRYDKDHWTITLDGTQAPAYNIQATDNKARAVFTVHMAKGQVKALTGGQKSFTAVARCYYYDGEFDEGSNHGSAAFSIIHVPAPEPIPVIIDAQCVIPNMGFDIVKFPAHDNTDLSNVTDRKVYINGVQVDDDLFFSRNYVFGIGNDGLKRIDVYYTSTDGSKSLYTGWAYIYNTKPNAQFRISGIYKQNRTLTVNDISNIGNVQIVLDNYPITDYTWSFRSLDGDDSSLRMRDISDLKKEIMYKKPGSYEIQLVVRNSLGRISDPYIFDFEICPDYQPVVEIDLNNTVIARNETISAWNYNAVSTDNDTIASNTIELWYDSNNDGTYDQKLQTWNGKNGFPQYTPAKLGRYKFINKVTESFGEPTLSEFIASDDTVTRTVEREFLVDNLIPMTGLYVQIPIVRPEIDAYFLLDANLNSDKTNYVVNNRIEFDNFLRSRNILPDVEIWDMKTYTYSQPASTSKHTGSSYPPATLVYTSNGYTGTLDRTSVSNNKYQTDEGHYESRTESKTATGTASGWSKNYYKYTNGRWVLTGSDGTNQPTISYSDSQGFKGTLSKTGFTTNSDNGPPSGSASEGATYTRYRTYTGYYSGTVTRTVQVWVPNLVWHNDYTGFYSGTIYKNVRQPYTDPFRATSDKYVIYVSDANIAELNDLKAVMANTDAKLILIGQESIKSQIDYDCFIPNNGPIEQVIQSALDYISLASPAVEEYTVLAGTDTFTLNVSDYDEENDLIVERKFQYVQDPDYFDNPTGMESFAAASYSDTSNWVDTMVNKFNKTGKFTIYRRIKDNPSPDPAFASYSKYSGTPMLAIYAHRKPIALCTLDWDYDAANNIYNTTWVDNSFDPDHQYSRPDKGIIDRKIMYRPVGGEWIYKIPDRLAPGSYELQYFVKDVENTWSDPYILNFTLSPAPPMQFNANLRTLDNKFSLSSIPASEYLEAYNVWTRYPYNVRLEMALYKGAARVSPLKTVNYSVSTGTKDDNDIYWNNIPYQIPDTLSDGPYTFRITAVGDYGQSANKDFPVTVNTPINLTGMINGAADNAQIQADSYNSFTFNTSRYVSRVQLNFKGQTYTSDSGVIALTSNNGTTKTWQANIYVPVSTVNDNETGVATFTAYTPSGKNQSVNVDYKVITIQAYDFTITSILDIGWRGYYFDLDHPINGDGEKYGYPKKPGTDIKTTQMPINSLSLVPYNKQAVKAGYKVAGFIRIKGAPDSAKLKARYFQDGIVRSADIPLTFSGSGRYDFIWIISQETDQKTLVGFDVELRKGGVTYGNEKWTDSWPTGNTNHSVFYIDGQAISDIEFNQSH
jgi:hypothetical protein